MKDPNPCISSLIRLQKLISQWVISIKGGFARQVVKYLRENLSPQERWQAASSRQGKRERERREGEGGMERERGEEEEQSAA